MKISVTILLFFLSHNIFSQNKFPDSTYKIPFDTNKIKEQTRLSGTSEVFIYDSLYVWNDKRSLSEIMDERPGYFIFDFGPGERNDINYNGANSNQTGVFRDGIQINDNFFQGFDIQNISVNEIDKIEEVSDVSSFFYGINSFSKSVNVITKDIFQPKPFSQLRFSQDRFGSLFADVFFTQPFSRKGNVMAGVTNQSIDGRYDNSSFSVWRGRGRINLFFSPKFNTKLNFYLDNYDRGLNDGLVYSTDTDSLTDPSNATVVNPSATEDLENYFYDLTLTGRFFKDKSSLTKLKIYSSNSLRRLINPDSSAYTGSYPSSFNHSVLYGADVTQNFRVAHNRNTVSDILIGGNVYINLFSGNLFSSYENNYFSLKAKYDFTYKNFFASALIRNDNLADNNYLNAGLEAKFNIINKKELLLQINGGLNETQYLISNDAYDVLYGLNNISEMQRKFYRAGGKIQYKEFLLSGEFYQSVYDSSNSSVSGVNANLHWQPKYADINISYNYSNDQLFPENYIKSDIAYKNILFRGKLKLKTGIDLKYYNINFITSQYQTSYSSEITGTVFPQTNQFIADFYVGARIGRANVNLTIANIFNSLVYNAYLFPLDDRGGFLNSISRFTIVWDFIN